MKIKTLPVSIPFLILLAVIIISCQSKVDRTADEPVKSYSFLLTGTEKNAHNTSFLALDDRISDTLSKNYKLKNIGQNWINEQWIINRGNEFFSINGGKFVGQMFVDGSLRMKGEIPFSDFARIGWYQWVSQDTLLIGASGHQSKTHDYALIDIKK